MKIVFTLIFLSIYAVAISRVQLHMGTYITLQTNSSSAINQGFEIFKTLDNQLSTYKPSSEVSKYNKNPKSKLSNETKELIIKSEEIKKMTNGYFNINYKGAHLVDFGGIAKGYAVDKVAQKWKEQGIKTGSISASGDIRCMDIWWFGSWIPQNIGATRRWSCCRVTFVWKTPDAVSGGEIKSAN